MPDLPTPKDAAEAALFSECWDAVLSYADLCTSGSTAANQLAREAFALGIHEARAAEDGTARGAGRRSSRLPRIPLLLTAVRNTAAAWEAEGQGHKLDPDLRLWLNSDKAWRYSGPPLSRPIALRGLRDMGEADATLLWLAEVEALPLRSVVRRQGLDPDASVEELNAVRGLFRDRCHRNHLDTPMSAECRSYVRLLDAVTRSPGADTPDDLSRHLATCVECAEAAACLRLHGGGLPAALAGGVIGWGGLAYLERRRRAAEVRLGAGGRPDVPDAEGQAERAAAHRARLRRHGLLAAAVLVSGLALAASLMPFGGDGGTGTGAQNLPTDSSPVAGPGSGVPSSAAPKTSTSAQPSSASPAPSGSDTPGTGANGDEKPDPEPQGTSSSTAGTGGGDSGHATVCEVRYELVNQWPDGFQASVTFTSPTALESWRVAWSFEDGQHVDQMWDASVAQRGSRVTATAADYNRSVTAGSTVTFGFLASWQDTNTAPSGFTLNGQECAGS
ncbi:cellulose binding domain-containing protein [Streptomyces sp. NBC_00582]|uniref:cellulose binding domain-containing protein n=1 Tax=Streptomyces sp. NBC_00582 TaxID=2975783 RepID=UPI001062BBD9|nr:cellulose-binding domain-containing protein [Streptomyces sp. NBC_00582]WUB61139.1 cellulose-binding domain-containing protein [Streptomyces sp. NBC_00582]